MRHCSSCLNYGNGTNKECTDQVGTACGAIREDVQNESKSDAKHIKLSENRL